MKRFEQILTYFLTLSIVVVFVGGCTEEYRRAQEQKQIPVADQTVQAEVGGKRFRAAFHGEFKGGYDNNVRHIFIITDSKTGKQYLTITGCGVTELRTVTDDDSSVTLEE